MRLGQDAFFPLVWFQPFRPVGLSCQSGGWPAFAKFGGWVRSACFEWTPPRWDRGGGQAHPLVGFVRRVLSELRGSFAVACHRRTLPRQGRGTSAPSVLTRDDPRDCVTSCIETGRCRIFRWERLATGGFAGLSDAASRQDAPGVERLVAGGPILGRQPQGLLPGRDRLRQPSVILERAAQVKIDSSR